MTLDLPHLAGGSSLVFKTCAPCGGSGWAGECTACDRDGERPCLVCNPSGSPADLDPDCWRCSGRGFTSCPCGTSDLPSLRSLGKQKTPCEACAGFGEVSDG